MKTHVFVSFNYGGWMLWFEKTFDLPFAPFLGLNLQDNFKDFENTIAFKNTAYTKTEIYFNVAENYFEVNVSEYWKRPVDDETIDDTIELFANTGWRRIDKTDVQALKELMKRNS